MKKQLLILGMLCTILIALNGCSSGSGYYRSGKRCFISGNYEEAADNFLKAMEQNSNRADYFIDYGMTLIALGRYEEALEQFDRVYMEKDVLVVKRNNERALRGKGIAYYNMKQYEEANRQFDAALSIGALSKLDLDILYYKGSSLLMIGSYEAAAENYTKIIEEYGKDAEAISKRAYAYQKMGEYESSLADYDLAISLVSDCYEYYFGKYYLMKDMGNASEAAQVLLQASKIPVKSKEDQYKQAKIHYYQETFDLALTELSEGYANGFKEAYFYIGEIYRKQKDYSTAIYYYEKFIEEGDTGLSFGGGPLQMKTPAAYNQIATCLMKQGNYHQALRFLERGISFQHAEILRPLKKNEIIAYENLGKFDIALEKLMEYLKNYPEDEEASREILFLQTRLPAITSQETSQ